MVVGACDCGCCIAAVRALASDILAPDFGLFVYENESRLISFNGFTTLSLDQIRLIGSLVGVAVFNACLVDLDLAPFLYNMLLGEEPTLRDLEVFQPTLARSLKQVGHDRGRGPSSRHAAEA